MSWFKKKFEEAKHEIKGELKHRANVRAAQKESYRENQIREAKRYGAKKAKHEYKQKYNAMAKPKSNPAYNFGGFAGPTTRKPTPSVGIADYMLNSSPRTNKGPSMGDMLGGVKPKRKGAGVPKDLREMGL